MTYKNTFNRDGIPYKADFRTMEQQREDGQNVTKRASDDMRRNHLYNVAAQTSHSPST